MRVLVILSRGVIILHDDIYPHMACIIHDPLSSMSWTHHHVWFPCIHPSQESAKRFQVRWRCQDCGGLSSSQECSLQVGSIGRCVSGMPTSVPMATKRTLTVFFFLSSISFLLPFTVPPLISDGFMPNKILCLKHTNFNISRNCFALYIRRCGILLHVYFMHSVSTCMLSVLPSTSYC